MIKRLLYGSCSRKPENLDPYLSQHLHPQVEMGCSEMEKVSALMDVHFFTNPLQEMEAFCSTLQLQKLKNVPSHSLGQKDTRAEGEPKQKFVAWAMALRDGPTISLDRQHTPPLLQYLSACFQHT